MFLELIYYIIFILPIVKLLSYILIILILILFNHIMGIGDWGLGIGVLVMGIGAWG